MPEAPAAPAPVGTLPTAEFDQSSSGLDAMFGAPAAPEPKPTPNGDPTPGDGGDAPFEDFAPADKPGDKPTPKPAEKTPTPSPKPADKPTPKPSDKPVAKENQQPAKTLRQHYEATKGELTKLQAEVKSLREAAGKPVDDKATKEWQGKHDDLQKRYDEIQNELKYVNYEKHPEFNEKYVKPMEAAYADGVEAAKGFRVTDDDGERHGNEKDFDDFMAIGDPEAAWQFAEKRFGTKATVMWNSRQNFVKALQAKNNALAEYRKTGAEREKQTVAQQEAQRKRDSEAFHASVKDGVEKYPDYFKEVDGDEPGNKLLRAGKALVDLAYGTSTPESHALLPAKIREALVDGKLPPQEMVKLHAAIYNMASGFNRVFQRNRTLSAQVKELTDKLAGLEASEPHGGGDGGNGGRQDIGAPNWEQQLEKMGR